MASTLSLSLVGRDLDKFEICITGTGSGVTDLDVTVIDPLEDSYTLSDLITDTYPVQASLPSSGLYITGELLYGSEDSNLIDGAYRVDYSATITGEGVISGTKYILFNNNAVQGWVDLMEKLPSSTADSYLNKRSKATEAREHIQAAIEFYKLSNFSLARKHLIHSLDISESA